MGGEKSKESATSKDQKHSHQNSEMKGNPVKTLAEPNKACERHLYLQLHYEVQVVGALVDVLQSYDILVLYPGAR